MGTTCQNCELCNNSQNPCVMGKGSKKAKIMFISLQYDSAIFSCILT